MSAKAHGTSHRPVQGDLRWDCSFSLADRICNYNRDDAEPSGYWRRRTRFLEEEAEVVSQTKRLGIVTSTTWGRRAGRAEQVFFYECADRGSNAGPSHCPHAAA